MLPVKCLALYDTPAEATPVDMPGKRKEALCGEMLGQEMGGGIDGECESSPPPSPDESLIWFAAD